MPSLASKSWQINDCKFNRLHNYKGGSVFPHVTILSSTWNKCEGFIDHRYTLRGKTLPILTECDIQAFWRQPWRQKKRCQTWHRGFTALIYRWYVWHRIWRHGLRQKALSTCNPFNCGGGSCGVYSVALVYINCKPFWEFFDDFYSHSRIYKGLYI